ncbi:hypothetical protein BDQ12DRAFT_246504 [Crucibulum laeve]|uniref:Uncharacterized protein n=1 Tax=Crucibulum laeve TaxID=68775 RepID=A0A5C3LU26_9AGAR|nr:hypothetical protein BDQ12DRAFT_246504 [Crucibulum laeve]
MHEDVTISGCSAASTDGGLGRCVAPAVIFVVGDPRLPKCSSRNQQPLPQHQFQTCKSIISSDSTIDGHKVGISSHAAIDLPFAGKPDRKPDRLPCRNTVHATARQKPRLQLLKRVTSPLFNSPSRRSPRATQP